MTLRLRPPATGQLVLGFVAIAAAVSCTGTTRGPDHRDAGEQTAGSSSGPSGSLSSTSHAGSSTTSQVVAPSSREPGTSSSSAAATSVATSGITGDGGMARHCGPGLECQGQPSCGFSDGRQFTACDCTPDGGFHCGAPAMVNACPADPSQLPQCQFEMEPRPLCGSVGPSGCQMAACQQTQGGLNLGWGGNCERVAQCPPPGFSLCGDQCVPGAGECVCQQGPLNATLVPCVCVAVPVGVGGFYACSG